MTRMGKANRPIEEDCLVDKTPTLSHSSYAFALNVS